MKETLVNCKACGQQIAKSAKKCPHCGAKNKKGIPVWLVAVLAVILVVAIVSAGDSEPQKVGDVSNPTTSANSADNTQSTESKEPVKTEKTRFSVGEIAELKNVKVALLGVTESEGSQFNKPGEGNVFVVCEFEIANDTQEEIVISSMLSFEGYCDDYACTYSLGALMEKGDKNQLDGTVAPGKKMKGVIGYEVPTDWKELEIQFTPDVWSGKEIVFTAANT